MGRRMLVAASLAAVTVLGMAPGGAGAAATKGACVLTGAASIPAGLTTTTKPINFTFAGKFANCTGTGAVKSGTVTASGSGTGSCSGNSTSGTASITWNTGQTSSLAFTTKGTGLLVQVAGKFTGGLFAGSTAKANLLFYTAKPADCTKPAGLKAASFAGPSTIGV